MRPLGRCAYPPCGQPVVAGGLNPPGREPVMLGKGFYEIRAAGGAHAFIGGIEPVVPNDSRVWHKDCAIRHRDEARSGVGRQQALL